MPIKKPTKATVSIQYDDENDILATLKTATIQVFPSETISIYKDFSEFALVAALLNIEGVEIAEDETYKKFEYVTKKALAEKNPEEYGAYFNKDGEMTDYIHTLTEEEVEDWTRIDNGE